MNSTPTFARTERPSGRVVQRAAALRRARSRHRRRRAGEPDAARQPRGRVHRRRERPEADGRGGRGGRVGPGDGGDGGGARAAHRPEAREADGDDVRVRRHARRRATADTEPSARARRDRGREPAVSDGELRVAADARRVVESFRQREGSHVVARGVRARRLQGREAGPVDDADGSARRAAVQGAEQEGSSHDRAVVRAAVRLGGERDSKAKAKERVSAQLHPQRGLRAHDEDGAG
eukprot:5701-Pelagococcus_subviridis.AAC.1